MIKRHRSRMAPGGVGYSDSPTFGGFGPKLPFSIHAMELGDLEAAFVGNLARYCMAMGTIPQYSLRGLWWVNGECKGLAVMDWESDVEPIQGLINHLIRYAPFIVGTEGVEDILENGRSTRWYGEKMFPREVGEWVTVDEAAIQAGRSTRTITRWIQSGAVRALGEQDSTEVLLEDVFIMKKVAEENMKRGRPNKARDN